MKFVNNIKKAFSSNVENVEKDRGDLVQTVIITAGFAVAGFLLVSWISTALLNKGADIAGCIEGSSTYTGGKDSADNCASQDHASGDNSFKSDEGYKGRFG